ncbi:hypothetical protein N7448_005710 [Penicillium atrosanguineum]|nr:hypothetical protein N7448_005710 [Penicillium atrosanguineum]
MAVPSRNIFSIFDIILTDSTVDAARRVLPNSPVCVLEAESVKIANWSEMPNPAKPRAWRHLRAGQVPFQPLLIHRKVMSSIALLGGGISHRLSARLDQPPAEQVSNGTRVVLVLPDSCLDGTDG